MADKENGLEMAELGSVKKKVGPAGAQSSTKAAETGRKEFDCKKLPFCCDVQQPGCICQQGDHCTCCAGCAWAGVVALVVVILLFFSSFWPCWGLAQYELADPGDMESFVAIHDDPSQPSLARERSQMGIISVINYNLFMRPQLVTDPDTMLENDFKDERLDDFIAQLDQYDVLLLQELWVVLSDGRKQRLVAEAREAGFPYYVRGKCLGQPIDSMLLILSRHPLVLVEEHTFETTLGGEALASKGILYARAWVNGNSSNAVDFFTTHMLAGYDAGDGPSVRSAQTQELVQFVQAQNELRVDGASSVETQPAIVIAGDFNIDGRDQHGVTNQHFWQLLSDMSPLNSSNALSNPVLQFMLGHGDFVMPVTYPEPIPTDDGLVSNLLKCNESAGNALDYLWFVQSNDDGQVQPVAGSASVNHMMIADRPYITLSDHFAITFNLTN